jgi:hypothetical protein
MASRASLFLAICFGCSGGTQRIGTHTVPAVSRQNSLVGTWESASLAYEMMGTTLIFAPDGTFATIVGVMLNGTYRISGNTLTLTLSGPGQPRVESTALHFLDRAVEVRAEGRNRRLVPLTRTSSNSLVGQWLGTLDNGVTSYEEYTRDGRMRLRMPSRVGRGRYVITGDTTVVLQMTSPPSAKHPGSFRIRGDTLRTGPSASDMYIRARPLIPDDVQQPKVPVR